MLIVEHPSFYCIAGSDLDASSHAHKFIQLTVLNGKGTLTSATNSEVGTLFLTPSKQSHSITHSGDYVLVLIDPASCLGKCIAKSHLLEGTSLLPFATQLGQLTLLVQNKQFDRIEALLNQVFANSLAKCTALDKRIAQTLTVLTQASWPTASLSQLASHVHLSPSRFSHLFKAQMGLPLKSYLRYLRFHHALPLLGKQPLTDIALACGFSDSAHFSRECKSLFGINPKHLKKPITHIQLN